MIFSFPFHMEAQRWYSGTHGPVALRMGENKNQLVMKNITADLQGWYPWSSDKPLRLSKVGLDVLGGQLRMASLQMPQSQPATVR
ncbi:intermembrane phospholipid transport protein YdbH family protein, partial [Erwinia amylovora]|uniref:intermembrane phospholipid transport protein YdbH family protein n=1 Tax=Erwinia amylovora TaxID=552 RepID=UPI001F0BFB66